MLFDGKVIIDGKCNEMEKKGFVLISTIITLGAKAILIFKKKIEREYVYINKRLYKRDKI